MKNDFLKEVGIHGVTARMKRIVETLTHSSRDLYKSMDLDIEPNWYLVFRLLHRNGALTIIEIANQLKFAHPTVIAMVNKMKKKGYLISSIDAKDSRRKPIELTKKSKTMMPEFESIWAAGQNALSEIVREPNVFLTELDFIEAQLQKASFMKRTQKVYQMKTKDFVTIIPFEDKYAQDFANLNFEWLEAYFYIELYDREVLTNPEKYIIDKGGIIFFARYLDEIAGTVALMPTEMDGYELTKMAVSPKFRGLKIGQILMDKCISYAKKSNFDSLVLYSNTKLTPAINLYKKVGFKRVDLPKNLPYKRSDIKMKLSL